MSNLPNTPRICSTGHCKNVVADSKYKRCEKCRERDRVYQENKRAKEKALKTAGDGSERLGPGNENSKTNGEDGPLEIYEDAHGLMEALRSHFKHPRVSFRGAYQIPIDSMVDCRERAQMTAREVWQVTGYRFTVHDHEKLKTGHKIRLWCSQDEAHRKAYRTNRNSGPMHRDNPGMHRFCCNSKLLVTCKTAASAENQLLVSIYIKHEMAHVPYYDVALPPDAAQVIRDNIGWATPNELVRQIQATHPNVTAKQIHAAWTKMSETLWKRDPEQLLSARTLLEEFKDDVDVFEVKTQDGVEQICWGMKRINMQLRGKIVEIGLDATYNTNSKHLELYSIMAEHDNAGFPLSYCLLSTATSIEVHKRTNALKVWRNMSGTRMAREVWPVKLQLCWWHLRRAVRQRFSKNKLSTSPYDAHRAHDDFPFISPSFVPTGQADASEHEGGIRDARPVRAEDHPGKQSVNAVHLRIHVPPSMQQLPPPSPFPSDPLAPTLTSCVMANTTGEPQAPIAITTAVDIVSKPSAAAIGSGETEEASRRTFCPEEFREPLINMMERHFCAHPLIPGYSHPSPEGIREWAVKEVYAYCVQQDLREVWAYLWENWYRRGRWELWARAPDPQIPRLKTTMLLESHWRRIKHDFLNHFHQPRIDLLVWILVVKLAPTYYRKLDIRLNDIGRFRELADWHKSFKREWKRCENAPYKLPLNPKYRPDPYRWVCTLHPVNPAFFLEVTRNRTIPFWSHTSLIPLNGIILNAAAATNLSAANELSAEAASNLREGSAPPHDDDVDDSDSESALVDVGQRMLWNAKALALFDWLGICEGKRRPFIRPEA
ncbi:hypothetical protein A0H81_00404 [Grifola frondosa]|uniref:MULE transposase domain-containing protein n=1 Tax=Grifola frondosa TaxID=5627 RepID=A0A1C7MPD3_GRIFR|nr:hypothetical protein A0H81_00404 [Grifola frondosa]